MKRMIPITPQITEASPITPPTRIPKQPPLFLSPEKSKITKRIRDGNQSPRKLVRSKLFSGKSKKSWVMTLAPKIMKSNARRPFAHRRG